MMWITVVKKFFVITEYTNVTNRQRDGRTDRRTPHDGIGSAYA